LDLWKWGRKRPWGRNPWEHYDDMNKMFLNKLNILKTNIFITWHL
jgi:hypothetical protein